MRTTTTHADRAAIELQTWHDRQQLVAELGITERGESQLVAHRLTCRLKAHKTPAVLVGPAVFASRTQPVATCTTCQPSQRQLTALTSYVQERVRALLDSPSEPCLDDPELRSDPAPMSDERVVELFGPAALADDLDTFLATAAPKRVREIAQGADVVPLVRKGKHNVRRNARHDQRDAQSCYAVRPGTLGYQQCQEQRGHEGDHRSQDGGTWSGPCDDTAARPAASETKRCVDCQKDVKLTSFPTSTKGGQIVRLDYCRPCRSIRAAAKGGK